MAGNHSPFQVTAISLENNNTRGFSGGMEMMYRLQMG